MLNNKLIISYNKTMVKVKFFVNCVTNFVSFAP